MKVIIFGATGMVGGGVLRECLLDSGVEQVLTVVRNATGQQDGKLREIVHGDMLNFAMTISAAETLVRLNPEMTFVYVTGAGTDSTEKGRVMWARVKGATENALLRMPFKGAYMFRPAAIQPLHGIRSKTRLYQAFYVVLRPLLSLGARWLPKYVTTTEQVGKAMLKVARKGANKRVLESEDINAI